MKDFFHRIIGRFVEWWNRVPFYDVIGNHPQFRAYRARLAEAIKDTSQIRPLKPYEYPFVFVESRVFYRSALAETMGFRCTEAELDAAERDPRGFIRNAHGAMLYLSSWVPARSV